jgi:hypothetical protein
MLIAALAAAISAAAILAPHRDYSHVGGGGRDVGPHGGSHHGRAQGDDDLWQDTRGGDGRGEGEGLNGSRWWCG